MRLLRAVLASLVLAATPLVAQAPGASTTIIVVRHAEKAAEPAADPALTAAGAARAEALVDVVKDAGVRTIISTGFVRTRSTAAPAAARLGLTTEIVDPRATDHVASLAAGVLARHRGETVLVVGHSNTVPAIVAALGAPAPAPICDAEYDDLYIVTVPPAGRASVVHAKYGAASPADASCRRE
ncbi:MAG: Phosphoglycerate mutase [Gemmatimonadetes bacterium]|jgi:broad specificity phosphatase PhoE|nr:Phosphoglycerate mutase [Gemmatimonadota bacterium]